MGIDHPPRNKRGRLGEPSLRADETTDDAISLLKENAIREDEPALWGDEHTDDIHSLRENAPASKAVGSAIGPHPQKRRSRKVTPQNRFDLRVSREMISLGGRIAA